MSLIVLLNVVLMKKNMEGASFEYGALIGKTLNAASIRELSRN